MDLVKSSQIYYVNSTYKITGTDSSFLYQIQLPPNSEFNRVTCLAASIPKSFYTIETGFNVFQLNKGTTVDITLSVGNYNRKTLASALATLLTNASPNKWTYSVTYPNVATTPDTGFYTFSVAGSTSQPSFIFTSSSPFEALGFTSGTFSFTGSALTSTNVTKLYLQDNILIHSDICQNYNDNVLQEIYTGDTTAFANIVFYNSEPIVYSKKITTNNSNIYNFYLTDDSNNQIDLHGNNMLITILLFHI